MCTYCFKSDRNEYTKINNSGIDAHDISASKYLGKKTQQQQTKTQQLNRE